MAAAPQPTDTGPRPSAATSRRPAGGRGPSLPDLVFEGFKSGDLRGGLRRDLRGLYRFYLDEERRAELAAMGRVRRSFKILSWLLKSLLQKLSPGRRLALASALVMAFLGETTIHPFGFRTDLRLWGFGVLLLVLMLELKDGVLARDEIEVARQVQMALLPARLSQPRGWSLGSYMRPANDVGADLVDCFDLPGGRIGVALGDVAGKGLGAALLTAKLQATLRALAPEVPSLADLGTRLNAILHRDGLDNRFVTLFYFEIEPGSGRIRYLNAGHNPPLVVRRDAIDTLDASSIPLGMLPETEIREGEARLEPGDLLLAYSDGLTEARGPGEEEFGMDRLRRLAPRLLGLSADPATGIVVEAADAFLGGEKPHDDLSLIVAVRVPESPPEIPGSV
ncbi:MAG: PP2C family protein-serine/threonine phosphatase [Candidatus Polarisedimenticolia bacterium]